MALDRRSFITLVVGGAAGTLFTPVPWKLTDDVSIWTQNWSWIPRLEYGELYSVKSTCKLCPAGCGLEIQTVAGRPITAKGDPEHPLSQGGICPLGACSVQLLYSPSRVKGPMKKTGEDKYESISWDEARKILGDKLSAANNVAMVSGDENGTVNELLAGFVAASGSNDFYLMPGDYQSCSQAWKSIMNGQGQVGYDIENSDYVLMLGADALSSWGTIVRNQKAYGAKKGKYVYAGPVQTGTGASADKWIPINPGCEDILALGIAYHLMREGRGVFLGSDFNAVRRNIESNYDPAKVSEATGVSPDSIRDTALELLQASKPVVICGSAIGQGNGPMSWAAGLLVNLLLDNINRSGGMTALPEAPKVVDAAPGLDEIYSRSLVRFMENVENGRNVPDVIMVYEANPVYALPQAEKTGQAFEKIPFKVSFSTFMDETARMCDLILPNPHYLERLDDSYTPFGSGKVVYSASHPVIDPVVDARETAGFILELAKDLNIDLGYASYEKLLQAKASALGGNWRNISRGQVFTSNESVYQGNLILSRFIGQASPSKANGQYPIYVAPLAKMRIGNDKIAIPPFATVTIKDSELSSEGFYVQVNSATAFKYNLKQDQLITLTSEAGSCKALVNIAETIMDDVVAILTGFGHTAWDDFSKGKGDNAYKLLKVENEQATNVPVWSRTRVKIA